MVNSIHNKFYSPLRYPGGKTKLAHLIKGLFFDNNLFGIHYIEPYAGGAGIALSLLLEGYVSTITINDFDRSIYAFWFSVVNKNEELCRRIYETPVTIKTWLEQKEVQGNKEHADKFELGFSTFFLNRTNISGIIKGGVIGGKTQQGKYKLDARFNKKELIQRIRNLYECSDKIKITNEDALNLLKSKKSDQFFYCDPPYVNKAKNLYMNFYQERDHKKVAQSVLSKKTNFLWMISYDQDPLIQHLYSGCRRQFELDVNYGSSKRRTQEYVFLHPKIKVLTASKFLSRC